MKYKQAKPLVKKEVLDYIRRGDPLSRAWATVSAQRDLLLKVKELAVVLKTDEPNDWMDRLNEIAAEVDGVE